MKRREQRAKRSLWGCFWRPLNSLLYMIIYESRKELSSEALVLVRAGGGATTALTCCCLAAEPSELNEPYERRLPPPALPPADQGRGSEPRVRASRAPGNWNSCIMGSRLSAPFHVRATLRRATRRALIRTFRHLFHIPITNRYWQTPSPARSRPRAPRAPKGTHVHISHLHIYIYIYI